MSNTNVDPRTAAPLSVSLLKPITLNDMKRPVIQSRCVMNKVINRRRGSMPKSKTDGCKVVEYIDASGNKAEKIVSKRGRKSIQESKKRQQVLSHTNFLSLYAELHEQAAKTEEDLPKMEAELRMLEQQYERELMVPRKVGSEFVFITTPGLYAKIQDLKDKINHAKNNTPDNFVLKTSQHLQNYFTELEKISVVASSEIQKDAPLPSRCLVKIIPPKKVDVKSASPLIDETFYDEQKPATSLTIDDIDNDVILDTDDKSTDKPGEDDMDMVVFDDDEEGEDATMEQGIMMIDDSESKRDVCYVFFALMNDEDPQFVIQTNELYELPHRVTVNDVKKILVNNPKQFMSQAMIAKLPKPFFLLGMDGAPLNRKHRLSDICSKTDYGFESSQPLLIVLAPQPMFTRVVVRFSGHNEDGKDEGIDSIFKKKTTCNQLGSIMNAMLKDVCNEKLESAQAVESKEVGTTVCTRCKPRQLLVRDTTRGELACPKCGQAQSDMDNSKANVIYGEHHVKSASTTDTKERNFAQILNEFQVKFIQCHHRHHHEHQASFRRTRKGCSLVSLGSFCRTGFHRDPCPSSRARLLVQAWVLQNSVVDVGVNDSS